MSLETLKPIPVLTKAFSRFDDLIGQSSVPDGMRELLDKTAGLENLEVRGLEGETERVLREESVLLVCNHPHDAESIILLGTMPSRKDVSLIAANNQMRLGPNMATHILPVYPYRQEQTAKNLKLSVRLAKRFVPYPYSPEEMDRRNQETIANAAGKIDQGECVVLFPEGVSGRSGKWRNGIGYLVQQIKNKKNSYLVMAYVDGTSDWDPLRVIPGLKKIFQRGSITYALPIEMSSMPLTNDPKELTRRMNEMYRTWVSSMWK